MAKMYFYKFNINSKIYDVYKNPELQDEILQQVFEAIDTDLSVKLPKYDEEALESDIEYKFCDIDKDKENRIITGRLVKIFDGETQSYDRSHDTVTTNFEEDKASSATFCFDVNHEEIAFITRVGFRYLQFGRVFKLLLEKVFQEDSFVLVLEKNVGELKEKVYALKRVIKVNTSIIPPNANESEFENLLGPSVAEFRETGATKYTQGIEVPVKGKGTINAHTTFFERIFYAIGKGYAEMVVDGRDAENEKVSISSDEDTPYKDTIPDVEKDSIPAFRERAGISIAKLLRDKNKIKLRSEVSDKEEHK